MPESKYPSTPDGRYVVVNGRLWRMSNPALSDERREALVKLLMDARRRIGSTKVEVDISVARKDVESAKLALGERGPVWWTDGAPDFNRKMVANTPYSEWFAAIEQKTID